MSLEEPLDVVQEALVDDSPKLETTESTNTLLEEVAPVQSTVLLSSTSLNTRRGSGAHANRTPLFSAGADRPLSATISSLPSREGSLASCKPNTATGQQDAAGIKLSARDACGLPPGTSDSQATAGWVAPWSGQDFRAPSPLFLTAVGHTGSNPTDAPEPPPTIAAERRTSSSTSSVLPGLPGTVSFAFRPVSPRPISSTDELLAAAAARLNEHESSDEEQEQTEAQQQQRQLQVEIQQEQPQQLQMLVQRQQPWPGSPPLLKRPSLVSSNTVVALGLLGSGPLAPFFDNGRRSFVRRQPTVVMESSGRRRLVSRDGGGSPPPLSSPTAGAGVRAPAMLGLPSSRTLHDSISISRRSLHDSVSTASRGLYDSISITHRGIQDVTPRATIPGGSSWAHDQRVSLSSHPQRPSSSSPPSPSPPSTAPQPGSAAHATTSSGGQEAGSGVADSADATANAAFEQAHATADSATSRPIDAPNHPTSNHPAHAKAHAGYTKPIHHTNHPADGTSTTAAANGGAVFTPSPPSTVVTPAKRRARMQAYSARRRTHGSPSLSPEASEQLVPAAPVLHLSTVSPVLEPLEPPRQSLAHVVRVLHTKSGAAITITKQFGDIAHHAGDRQSALLPRSCPVPLLPSMPRFTPLPQQQPPTQPLRPLLARAAGRGTSARSSGAELQRPSSPQTPTASKASPPRGILRQGRLSDLSATPLSSQASADVAPGSETPAAASSSRPSQGGQTHASEASTEASTAGVSEAGSGGSAPRAHAPPITLPRRPVPYSAADSPILSPTSLPSRAAAHAAAANGGCGVMHAPGDSPLRGSTVQPMYSPGEGAPAALAAEENGMYGVQSRSRSPTSQHLAMGGPFSLRRTVYYDWVESTPLVERLGAGSVGGVVASGLEGKALVLKRQLPDRSSPVYFKPAYQKPLLGGDVLHVL